MTTLILHHYPASPFAEKIRLILGYKQVPWKSVLIPVIMPKPDLVALTGGYRKTPVLQIGGDIYCDTALIAQVIDHAQPINTIYPAKHLAASSAMAAWADSVLFSAAVSWALQPEGAKSMFASWAPEQLAAFAADRKQFRANSPVPRTPLEAASRVLAAFLPQLDRQLDEAGPFLFGAEPTIADFSVYHPLWFINGAPAVSNILTIYPAIMRWMQMMVDASHGSFEKLTGEDAIAIAKSSTSQSNANSGIPHRAVVIAASDYGMDPVAGQLINETPDTWTILRDDPRAGSVRVHFPKVGYSMTEPAH